MALAQHVTSPLPLITLPPWTCGSVSPTSSIAQDVSVSISSKDFAYSPSHHCITALPHHSSIHNSRLRLNSSLNVIPRPQHPLRWTKQNKAPITKESCERVAEPQLVIQLALSRNRDGSFSHCDPVAFFEDKAPSPSPTRYPDKWDQLLDVLPIAIYIC
jgi:hypothetical protein